MITFTFAMPVNEMVSYVAGVEKRVQSNLRALTHEWGQAGVSDVASFMPEFRGIAKSSMDYTTGQAGNVYFAQVYSNDDEAKIRTMEGGRARGAAPPPASVLLPWVQAKWGGGMADAVALPRAIHERGSHKTPEGHQMFQKGYDLLESRTNAMLDRAGDVFF